MSRNVSIVCRYVRKHHLNCRCKHDAISAGGGVDQWWGWAAK
jgi:hypothetical protein